MEDHLDCEPSEIVGYSQQGKNQVGDQVEGIEGPRLGVSQARLARIQVGIPRRKTTASQFPCRK